MSQRNFGLQGSRGQSSTPEVGSSQQLMDVSDDDATQDPINAASDDILDALPPGGSQSQPTGRRAVRPTEDSVSILFKRYPTVERLFKFEKANARGNRDANCLGCNESFKEGRIDRLVNHANFCRKTDPTLASSFKDEYEFFLTNKRSKKPGLDIQKRADRSLARAIACNDLPISVVESEEMRDFITLLNPVYKLPSRRKMSSVLIPTLANELRTNSLKLMAAANNYTLTIEFDGWTSNAGMHVVAIVLTDLVGRSYVLDLIDTSDTVNTAESLAELAVRAVEESGIELCKFNSIITDEASNCKAARQLIKQNLAHGALIEYRCMAHLFNLIGAGMSKNSVIKPTLEQLLELINILSRHKLLISAIRKHGGNKAVRSVPTRWYSTSASLLSVLRLKPILERLPQTNELVAYKWAPIINDRSFWTEVQSLVKYFSKLSDAIASSETRNSKLGDTMNELLRYGHYLFREADQRSVHCRAANESFLIYFARSNYGLLLAAYALNPNFKFKFMTEKGLEVAKETMITVLVDMSTSDETCLAFLSEFERYRKVVRDRSAPIDNLFSWWNSCPLNLIKLIGSRFAACHASSANTERIFSSLTRTITPSRNRLNLNLSQDLLCIKIIENSRPARTSKRRLAEIVDAMLEDPDVVQIADDAEEDDEQDFAYDGNIMTDQEASLLDEELMSEAGNIYDLSENIAGMQEYKLFFELIDFDSSLIESIPESSQPTTGPRRSSSEHAKELMRRARNEE